MNDKIRCILHKPHVVLKVIGRTPGGVKRRDILLRRPFMIATYVPSVSSSL